MRGAKEGDDWKPKLLSDVFALERRGCDVSKSKEGFSFSKNQLDLFNFPVQQLASEEELCHSLTSDSFSCGIGEMATERPPLTNGHSLWGQQGLWA